MTKESSVKKNGWIRKTSCNFDPPNQRMCVNIFFPFHKHFTQAICTSMKFSCLVKKCRAKKKIATFCYNVVNNQAVKIDRSARTIKVTSEQLSSYVEFISAIFFISISKTPTKRTKKLIEFNGFTPNPNARENPMRCIDEMNAQPSKTNYGLCIIWISECEMRCGSVSLMNCRINGQVTCKHNDGADFCYRYVIIGMDLWNFFLICQFLYILYREVTRSNHFWHLNWAIIHWNSPKCQNNVTLNFIFRWEMSTIPTKISGIFRHMWHADTFPFPTQMWSV